MHQNSPAPSSALKINFSELPHQAKAIQNLAEVFTGVRFMQPQHAICNPHLHTAASCEQIRKNLARIRARDGIMRGEVRYVPQSPLELDVLMETGTGKTFTFIETMYKLHELHGLSKFIVLVPSNPIRKGALKNIEITRDFFGNKYDNRAITAYDYSVNSIDSYLNSSNRGISVLIMTFQSFNSVTNIINQQILESNLFTQARSYMEALAALNPVVIIDEPHRFVGAQTKKYLDKFQPQIILRYGATFPKDDYKNLIYILDSVDAFKQHLVKDIVVQRPRKIGKSDLRISYKGYAKQGQDRVAEIVHEIEGLSADKRQLLRVGDNLGKKLDLHYLQDYSLTGIHSKKIVFANEVELAIDEVKDYSMLEETKAKIMLQQTIKTHFEKEEYLFKQGIKALALIFIDSRSSYMLDDGGPGELNKIFNKFYKQQLQEKLKEKLGPEYRSYLERTMKEIDKVHKGYFAISKETAKGDKGKLDDIDLILKEKEKLLSSDETVLRFIFSKWALREGWDNPNIFTICKLAPSSSRITKLQQIGRGLRLAVKQTRGGFDRITFDTVREEDFREINLLDVIVPEEERDFVEGIQRDINANNVHNQTNLITGEKLVEREICFSPYEAHELFNCLISYNLIDFNRATNEGTITHDGDLDAAITDAQAKQIEFDTAKLRELYDSYVDLNRAVRSKSDKTASYAKINPQNWQKFKILWSDINRQAEYKFTVDKAKLKQAIVNSINAELEIPKIEMAMEVTMVTGDKFSEQRGLGDKIESELRIYSFKDFVRSISNATKLPFNSIIGILQAIDRDKFAMLANDEESARQKIVELCRREIRAHILGNLSFTIYEGSREALELLNPVAGKTHEIKVSAMGRRAYDITNAGVKSRSLTTDKIGYDSEFELEVIKASNLEKVEVFSKLPAISIPIPGFGKSSGYSPDFAYVVSATDKDSKKIKYHFIIETKGYDSKSEGREIENFKIEVARKFFAALADSVEAPIGYDALYKNDAGLAALLNMFENKLISGEQ